LKTKEGRGNSKLLAVNRSKVISQRYYYGE